jgi:hypothetical protein
MLANMLRNTIRLPYVAQHLMLANMTKPSDPAPKCPDCGVTLFFGSAHNCKPKRAPRPADRLVPAEPKPRARTGKSEKRHAEISGIVKKALRPERTPEERDAILAELRIRTKRLTPHPDCPVCNARRDRERERMRKKRKVSE